MRTRTLLVVGLLVVVSLALAIWIAVAEKPNAAAARKAGPTELAADVSTPSAPAAERVETPAPSAPIATPAVIADPPLPRAPERQSVWIAVVDHDGGPVIGATVMVSERMDPGPDDRTPVGASDARGRIELSFQGNNERYVRAFTLDHLSSGWARLSKLELDASQARLLPVERMAHVAGLVLDLGGLPVSRAHVAIYITGQVFGRPFAEAPPRLATDDKGRFESYIETFGGPFKATASVRGEHNQAHEFVLQPGQEAEFTLHVGDMLSVSGVVVAPDRSVVANSPVSVYSEPHEADPLQTFGQSCHSDERGRFTCELPRAGRYAAFASDERWASSDVATFDVTPDAPAAALNLVLVRGATIEGRVVREDGTPLQNVEVSAHHDECATCKRADLVARGLLGILHTKTDADGHFVLAPARADPHLYTVGCGPDPQRPKAWLQVRDVEAGRRDVEFVVSEAALVDSVFEGRVTLEDTGEPLTTLRIEIYRRRERYWEVARSETIESADGRFRVESLHTGTEYGAMISNIAGYMPVVVEPWTASRASKVLDLTMLRPRTLDVTVIDDGGVGIAGALVQYSVERRYPEYDGVRGFQFGRTDDTGFARMNAWPGSFQITASVKSRKSESLPIVIADRNAPLTLVVPSQ